jgi:hypothetical protein
MANCSWRFVVLALFVMATSRQCSAASIVEEEPVVVMETVEKMEPIESVAKNFYSNPALLALGAVLDEGVKKIVSSFSEVESAAEGMADNVVEYYKQWFVQFANDGGEYLPHLKEFYKAIPPKAYHKLILDCLRTALKQTQDHCGKLVLEHNPIHPGLKLETSRAKRSTEKMTLAKFGQSLSVWLTSIDTFVVEYLKSSIPVTCPMVELWMKELIQKVERMKPEEIKKEW